MPVMACSHNLSKDDYGQMALNPESQHTSPGSDQNRVSYAFISRKTGLLQVRCKAIQILFMVKNCVLIMFIERKLHCQCIGLLILTLKPGDRRSGPF
jgi:hypothetical protein